MSDVTFAYRVDIGWSPTRGYGATVLDVQNQRQKGIKGNSMRQLLRRIHEVIAGDEQQRRRFPLEHEANMHKSIVTPDTGDPLFKQV